jgi:hypothetical protein
MPLLTPVHFMLSAWLLPEHIADVLPEQARRIEELRRACWTGRAATASNW